MRPRTAGPGRSKATPAWPRYLAAGDYWFNDPAADHHDGSNGHIHT
ncbi:hypothetical protein [Streptomyces vinaceus]